MKGGQVTATVPVSTGPEYIGLNLFTAGLPARHREGRRDGYTSSSRSTGLKQRGAGHH